MAGMTAEALPEFGCVRLILDVRDWADLPESGQMLRSIYPPSDPRFDENTVRVRPRPTVVIGSDYFTGGYPMEMLAGGVDVWYDCEAPLDTPVWYLISLSGGTGFWAAATPYANLVPNGSFEAGITGWVADANATIAHETVAPLRGTGSLRITVTGSPTTTGSRPTPRVPVVAARTYRASAWLRATSATGIARIAVDFYTAGNVYISTLGPSVGVTANTTVYRSATVVAPPTAALAEVRVMWSGSPPTAAILRADDVTLSDMGVGGDPLSGQSVTLPAVAAGWLSNPEAPASNIRLELLPDDDCVTAPDPTGVIFASHGGETRAASGGRFDVVHQDVPSVITATRKAPGATLTLAALSFDDRDRVHTLLGDGDVLMLRPLPEFGISDRYLDVGDLSTSALSSDLRLPYRVLDLPYVSAPPPPGPTAGVLGTRFEDLNRYATWTAFDAAGLTSVALLMGAGSTLGVGA